MSFTYFKFLFANTIKRKSIWITWLLFLFTCTCFIIILPAVATMNTLQVWSNATMTICQTFMGMVAGLFTAVLSINIFKDTNEEGTELIVISKPISRFKLVLSKFLLFGFYCLMVNVSAVIISLFTIFLPRTEPEFYWGLVISMFIGNAVTFAVFGSISILLTLKFAKVGIIVVNILISLVFLIYQVLTLFVFTTPLKALTDNSMSASSYTLHNRNTETGDYEEDEVVEFGAAPLESGKPHPCQATDWKGIADFWEHDIKSMNPTPILNVTDVASQLALTYMSYKTHDYALRQSNRLFGFSRFYDYTLTSPASPEIIKGVENKKTLPWLYTGDGKIAIPISEDINFDFYFPTSYAFDGTPSVSGTSLRGYGKEIPIAHIKSKELLSAQEVFFEKEQWNKYAPEFDAILDYVYDFRRGYSVEELEDYPEWCRAFYSTPQNQAKFYDLLWQEFINRKIFFDIHTPADLNERILQFKNYAYWKLVKRQQDLILNGTKPASASHRWDDWEQAAKSIVYNLRSQELYPGFVIENVLGVNYDQPSGGWMITCKDGVKDGFLNENTQTISLDYLYNTWYTQYELMTADRRSEDEIKEAGYNSALYYYIQTYEIFNNSLNMDEKYLYTSLENSSRSSKYSSTQYFRTNGWVPNINGIGKSILGQDINFPIGQNLMLFYYKTTPTLQYWVFAVVWGALSLGMYGAGVGFYNKYDIK